MVSKPRRMIWAIVIAVFTAFPSMAAAGSWSPPDHFYLPGRRPQYSAVFDPSGQVHIAAEGVLMEGLWYVTQSGQQEVLGRRYSLESGIAYQSVSGVPVVRIVWVDTYDRSALWISRNDTGRWVSSRVWLGVAYEPSVAPLGAGVAIAFRDGGHRLRYLSWDPAQGVSSAVVVAQHCCTGPAALAAWHSTPAIAFSEADTGGSVHRLRLASRLSGGRWTLVTVDGHDSSAPSLAFTNRGSPVIAYDATGVWFASRSGSGWHQRQVLGTQYADAHIAADATGAIGVVADALGTTGGAGDWPQSRVTFRRLDIPQSPVTIAHASDLSVGWIGDPRVGLAGGKATVTFASDSDGDHVGGGLWVTHQP